jgi:hypothetical protein
MYKLIKHPGFGFRAKPATDLRGGGQLLNARQGVAGACRVSGHGPSASAVAAF